MYMYLGIDIGGTKTLVGVLSRDGVIVEEDRFLTPKDYSQFLKNVENSVSHFKRHVFRSGGVGIPALSFDRANAIGRSFGNLPWKNVPIRADLEKILDCPIVVENDAKMGGLSEAMVLKDKYSRVLYVAVGTGIGIALVVDQQIDVNIGDGGGRAMLLEYHSKLEPWESFASGRAIAERYGKQAKDIDDEKTWHAISRDLSKGLIELIAITEPEVIVIGGGVGSQFMHFGKILKEEISKFEIPMVKMPQIIGAKRSEQAVIYGCYDLAKQTYDHA